MSAALASPPEDPVAPEDAAPPEAAPPDPERAEIERRARRHGWKERGEHKGPEGSWLDAPEFLAEAEQSVPLLMSRLHRLEKLVEKADTQNRESVEVVRDMTDRLRKADERGYQRAMRELQAQRQQAVREGNEDAFNAAQREIDALEKDRPPPAREAPPAAAAPPAGVDPVVVAWGNRNPWFFSDPELQVEAQVTNDVLARTRPELSTAERLEEVTRRMKRAFPAKFQNARRADPSPVSSPSGESARRTRNPRDFDNLPADAKAQYDRYARMLQGKGKPLTKEEWASEYWAQEG